jgi:hypothetical protein
MNRRGFLTAGACSSIAAAQIPSLTAAPASAPPGILAKYTAEDHRQRLKNIAACELAIHSCLRKHLITNYLPGQCSFISASIRAAHLGKSAIGTSRNWTA